MLLLWKYVCRLYIVWQDDNISTFTQQLKINLYISSACYFLGISSERDGEIIGLSNHEITNAFQQNLPQSATICNIHWILLHVTYVACMKCPYKLLYWHHTAVMSVTSLTIIHLKPLSFNLTWIPVLPRTHTSSNYHRIFFTT